MENIEDKKAKRITSLVFLLVIVLLLAIGVVMSIVFHNHGSLKTIANSDKTAISDRKILFSLYNSGSSDAPSWNLRVYTDGSGVLSNPSTVFSDNTFDAKDLKTSLTKISLRGFKETCSANYSETLIYKDQVTKNINCYIEKYQSSNLSKDLSAAISIVNSKVITN